MDPKSAALIQSADGGRERLSSLQVQMNQDPKPSVQVEPQLISPADYKGTNTSVNTHDKEFQEQTNSSVFLKDPKTLVETVKGDEYAVEYNKLYESLTEIQFKIIENLKRRLSREPTEKEVK